MTSPAYESPTPPNRQRRHALLPARLRAPLQGDDGYALIELALTLPILFALLFCFMEMCLMFYSCSLISVLARQGTRYAMMHSSTCEYPNGNSCAATAADVNSLVSTYNLPNLAQGTITPSTSYSGNSNVVGATVTVKIKYVFPISMPFVLRDSVTFTSASVMPILQ